MTAPKDIVSVLDSYKKQKKAKGTVLEWTDSILLKMRDRMRKIARKHRGSWTNEFYEALQDLNKESAKRKFPAKTD